MTELVKIERDRGQVEIHREGEREWQWVKIESDRGKVETKREGDRVAEG